MRAWLGVAVAVGVAMTLGVAVVGAACSPVEQEGPPDAGPPVDSDAQACTGTASDPCPCSGQAIPGCDGGSGEGCALSFYLTSPSCEKWQFSLCGTTTLVTEKPAVDATTALAFDFAGNIIAAQTVSPSIVCYGPVGYVFPTACSTFDPCADAGADASSSD